MKYKFRSLFCLAILTTGSFFSFESTARDQYPNTKHLLFPAGNYSNDQMEKTFNNCSGFFPGHSPKSTRAAFAQKGMTELCSDQFAVYYSGITKTPLVVTETLNQSTVDEAHGQERTDEFFEDPRLGYSSRSLLNDFKSRDEAGNHYDRGHMFPAGDASSPHSMAQTFALSNMIPQNPDNNRHVWSKIESDVRKFASRAKGNVFVFTGPLFDSNHKTLGSSRVWIPNRIFKLIYDESSGRSWAYVVPNQETQVPRPISYDEFVQATGLKLLEGIKISGSIK